MRRAEAEADLKIVQDFQNGNEAVFDELVIKYKDRIFNMCLRMLSDYEEANDTAQEVFVKAYRGLNRFRSDAAFKTWLYRIAINTCKNKLRSLRFKFKKKTVTIDKPKDDEDNNYVELKDETMSPELAYEQKETEEQVQKAISALPLEQKKIVVLSDIDGLSYEEIIGITGLKLGTIKSKLFRARAKLKSLLKEL